MGEYFEPNTLNDWQLSILIIHVLINIFWDYTKRHDILTPKPQVSFQHLKNGRQEFHGKYVLVKTDKATNNDICMSDGCILLIT